MTLNRLLSEKRTEIVTRWIDAVFETYPTDTSNFLKKQENRFANPVGHAVSQGLEGIFDELLGGLGQEKPSQEKLEPLLDGIVRIRAVQDFTASGAVSFVYSLKTIIRELVAAEKRNDIPSAEILSFESQIDRLALSAFDIYMKCKEKIYDIRANEMQKMAYRLIERANKMDEAQGTKDDSGSGDSENKQTKEVTK